MKYNLPKEYLSWSQINLWNISRNRYIEQYINGIPQYETKELRFGKEFARLQEQENLLESEIRLEVEIDGIKVLGFLDKLEDNHKIIETKTGKKEWTQERVNNHGQLALYAWMYYKNNQVFPRVELWWYETEDNEEGEIELTGRVEKFEYQAKGNILEETEKLIKRTAKEISQTYTAIQESNIDHTLIDEYYQIEQEIQRRKKRQEQIKQELQPEIEKIKKYSNDIIKKYHYPDSFLKKEKDLKKEKKEIEKTAKFDEQKTLQFRIKK